VAGGDFASSLDLRSAAAIDLTAQALGLDRIKAVEILPWRFVEGRDYRVEIAAGGRSARLILLDKPRFLMAQIVILVQ
jgi:hypothetical protein